MSDAVNEAAFENLFAGGGELGGLMRSHNWTRSPLGSPEQWPQSLKTAVRIMLTSRQPMFVWWGEELTNLYNDAYKTILGGKHPEALGQPASHVWREIWDQVEPRAESAMLKNEGTYDEALLLIMERNGYPEETYYTFSYSPVPNDQGNTDGILCANSDDTQRIIGERQLLLLRDLAARTADAQTFDEACTLSASCLETNPHDLPFAVIYLVDPDQQSVSLAGTCGIDRNHAAIPERVNFDSDPVWQLGEVIRTQQSILISDLDVSFDPLPTGAWQRSPHQAIVVPISPSGQTGRSGVLVAGLNPFRLFDDNYQGFINLVAAQISASIANANAYEEERKRAEALAELDRAKTTFFSNVSHEFRTPLTLMLSPLEELANTLDDRLQPDQRAQLQLVQRNGLRLQKLVNTLLDFSRIEAGRVQAVYEPTDLASFTAELASTFRSMIEQAGMALQIDCPTLPEPVYVDHDLWEKIVLNLMSNAFKFTFSGSITVRLYTIDDFGLEDNRVALNPSSNQPQFNTQHSTLNTQHSTLAVLEVEDTGVGIPEAELPRLFERFHRVSGTRSRTYEGSGIGLALVQELVKLHGGTIQVTSQLEQGTTFTIALPFGSAHLPQDRTQTTRTLTSTALGAAPYVVEASRWIAEEDFRLPIEDFRLKDRADSFNPPPTHLPAQSKIQNLSCAGSAPKVRPKILLADDNADMRDYLKRLLSQYWDVEAVSDGLAALDAIRASAPANATAQRLPDLILSDVMMPRLDGFGLLRELRANSRTQEIPMILLSARAGEESRIEGLEAGADDYLIKPFSSRELLARVEAMLKLAQLRREASEKEQALRVEVQTAKENLENILQREQAARAEAERANRIKDEFLAILSHELRSPLNPILGWSNLLRNGRLDAVKTAYAVETIERNAKLQVQLIEDLLDVSRILRGKLSLNRVPVNLTATIQAAMETVRLAAEAKAIDLRFTILDFGLGNAEGSSTFFESEEQPDNPASKIQNPKSKIQNLKFQVLGDSARLQQVIWNLLTNAVKFTPNGGQVEVRLEQVQGAGNSETCHLSPETSYAQITVSDTGKGIPSAFLPHVFEYFRQADGTTTRKFGGLGLGLAIVRHLVELHGGTVQAESAGEGQGATFTVRLPLLKDKGARMKDKENSFDPSSPILHPLQGIRILLVDDDTDAKDLITFVLEQNGAIVTSVASASEALQALGQTKFDLLISDLGMPDVNGYMLIRQIRAMPPEQGGRIVAIALTAYAGEIDQQQALAAGFQEHISKPVELEKLMPAIVSLVKQTIT